jgi:hypothetical protein
LQAREREGERKRLESLLQSEADKWRHEHSRVEESERRAAELDRQLSEKTAEQQRHRERQLELERWLRDQTEQLAESAVAASTREAQIKGLNRTIEDLQLIQTTLCARVRELAGQQDLATKRINELNGQSEAATQEVHARDRELAALRYAILDAARVGAHINHARMQGECETVNGWRRMMTTLLQTPLSIAQRGIIAEITSALDGWRKRRAEAGNVEPRVEPYDLRPSEFHCGEVIESALGDVRKNASETGAKVQTSVAGPVPDRAHGCPRHIHQLVTTLAGSLVDLGCAETLEVQICFESKPNDNAQMLLSFLVSSAQSAESLCGRLRSLADASAALQSVAQGGLALSSAWQLAVALGGSPSVEAIADRNVRVSISLPILQSNSFQNPGSQYPFGATRAGEVVLRP